MGFFDDVLITVRSQPSWRLVMTVHVEVIFRDDLQHKRYFELATFGQHSLLMLNTTVRSVMPANGMLGMIFTWIYHYTHPCL